MNNTILIIGGDKRQEGLYRKLKSKAYKCFLENKNSANALSMVNYNSVLVLPVPFSSDGEYIYCADKNFRLKINDLLPVLRDNSTVISGGINEEIRSELRENGITYYDMCDSDFFTEYNAFLTAQGALKLLLDNTESLVTGRKVLITGFGRVAEALAHALKGVGTDVYILARNNRQLIKAGCLGFKTVCFSAKSSVICMFDYIFNTVPCCIFTESEVFRIRDDAVYFELASKPFGADKKDFSVHGKTYVYGGGLPGKFVSDSAAEIMFDYIENILKGRVI